MNQLQQASRSQFNAYRATARKTREDRYKKALTDANKAVGCSLTPLLRASHTARKPRFTGFLAKKNLLRKSSKRQEFTIPVGEHSYDKGRNCAQHRSSAARLEEDAPTGARPLRV